MNEGDFWSEGFSQSANKFSQNPEQDKMLLLSCCSRDLPHRFAEENRNVER